MHDLPRDATVTATPSTLPSRLWYMVNEPEPQGAVHAIDENAWIYLAAHHRDDDANAVERFAKLLTDACESFGFAVFSDRVGRRRRRCAITSLVRCSATRRTLCHRCRRGFGGRWG